MNLSFDFVFGLGLGFFLSCFFYVMAVVFINLARINGLRELRKINEEYEEVSRGAFISKKERKEIVKFRNYKNNIRELKDFTLRKKNKQNRSENAKVLTFVKNDK